MRRFIIVLALASLLIVSVFLNIKFFRENKYLKNSLPFLIVGEKISYFNLIGKDAKSINVDELNKARIALIFIINESCFNCSGNLPLFNKMSRILKKDGVKVFGIIPDDPSKMFQFSENNKLDFKLYTPEEPDKFKRVLRLKAPTDQILLYYKRKVVLTFSGILDGKSYTGILRKAKQIIKQK
jgi:peroxiredoxin